MPRCLVNVLWGALTAACLTMAPGGVTAGPEQSYFLGEAWEAAIVRGVDRQRQAQRRRMPPATILGRAERAARREATVVKLYLLARAYGLSALDHRERQAAAKDEAARAKNARAAREDLASAMATYREVLAQAPRCYFAYHDMGVLELRREKPDKRKAFGSFRNAYRINGRYTPTQRQLIRLYLEEKQYADALPLLRRIVRLEPDDDQARMRLVIALGELEQYDEAYAALALLRKKDPRSPHYRAMQAHLDARTARYDRAIATYKELARLNPNIPTAFLGIVECVQAMEARKLPVDLADFLYALKGLRRLMHDPAERRKLTDRIRRVEHAIAQPQGGAADGEPTTAQLLHALRSPDADMRLGALIRLMLRKEPATKEVIRAVAGRIDPAAEAAAPVRAGAIRCLGRMSGTALVPLLRLGLLDPDARVRVETADTLVAIGKRDGNAAGAVIAILGNHVNARSAEVGSAARLGILRLASVTLPGLPETADDAAHRRAFRIWWRGAAGETAQIDALDGYHRIRDRSAHDVLLPYMQSPSFHVFRAAYGALARSADFAGSEPLRRWYGTMPRIPDEQWTKANRAGLARSLETWAAARPGS